jgi:predicted RNase H-like HicB family nuclease
MTFTYPAVFTPNEDGSFDGYFPDLEGCVFHGENLDDAINNAIEEEREWITVETSDDPEEGLPYVSDEEDLDLKEGEFVRNIAVIIHFEVGYSD